MSLKGASVLVVDDEPALREIFATWVAREGATVYSAANGQEALEITQANHIDLVLSDVRMPVMDGITLAKRLKESVRYTIKVIFVSGFTDLNARSAFDLGVEELLPKPIKRKNLIAKLTHCLLDREEIWSELRDSPAELILRETFESLSSALETKKLAFGRGGFCIRHGQVMDQEAEMQLDLEFVAESHFLRGRGIVRWSSHAESLYGVELLFVDPRDRLWVLGLARENVSNSFIPAGLYRDS